MRISDRAIMARMPVGDRDSLARSRSLVFLRATAAFSCANAIRDSNSANSMSARSWPGVSRRRSVIDGDDEASAQPGLSSRSAFKFGVMLLSAKRDPEKREPVMGGVPGRCGAPCKDCVVLP